MSLCVACGLDINDITELCLCRQHPPHRDNWAESNRIECDFFHQKKPPMRLPLEMCEGEFRAHREA
jgi:hypothetical protein